MTPITMNWPHSYAVVFQNISGRTLDIPWLGRRGVVLKQDEIVAVVGDPLTQPTQFYRYDGKKSISALVELIEDGLLAVLSRPGGDKEKDNTEVPLVGADGVTTLPGVRIEM